MFGLNLSDIVTDKDVVYFCISHNIGKSDTIHLLENSVLVDCGYKKMHIKKIYIKT